jgi:hypothetical protein
MTGDSSFWQRSTDVLRLPESLAADYRLATAREVRHWSFGTVKSVGQTDAIGWEQQVGTLDDERIFGPLRDLACACGKYQGENHRGMICDWCGVKVTMREERRRRFGHIDLAVEVAHPLGDAGDLIRVVPVLSAGFRESPTGGGLAEAYEALVSAGRNTNKLTANLHTLIDILLPVATLAHEWSLPDSAVLARALVLARQEEA